MRQPEETPEDKDRRWTRGTTQHTEGHWMKGAKEGVQLPEPQAQSGSAEGLGSPDTPG